MVDRRRPAHRRSRVIVTLGAAALAAAVAVGAWSVGGGDRAPDIGGIAPFDAPATAEPAAETAETATEPAQQPTATEPTAEPTATEPTADPTAVPTESAEPAEPTAGTAPEARDATLPTGPAEPIDPPVRLQIPALSVAAEVVAVGVTDDGQMEVPASGDQIGWYRHGAAPGSEKGVTVLASHITTEQGWGVLSGIGELNAGDRVEITTADGDPVRYTVDALRIEEKSELDTAALFDRSGPPRVALVTCTGPWLDSIGAHRDNLIVTATRDGA